MSSSTLEDKNCAGSEYEKEFNEEEEEDEEEKERDDPKTEEPALQKTWRPAWAPRFVSNSNKEVYYYVDQKIIIQEGLDSFAGMISLAATALCHYLDTHREQLRLLDKAVLEIGAGTGLVSIVATLLGAQVTATDQPQILNNLRMNVRRNTRDCCRYTPQVAALSWGHDLEHTYPTSVYRYDYVLAADVASHYYCLDKLLVTMKHFCKPGTTLVWANKVRSEADLTFIENFKKTFNASLLAEDGDMKIFMATSRDGEIREEHLEQNYCEVPLDSTEPDEDQNKDVSGTIVNCDRSEDLCRDEKEQNDELKSDEEAGNVREDGYTEDTDSDCTMSSSTLEDKNCAGSEYEKEFNEEEEEDEEEKERDDPKTEEPALQKTWRPAWAPRFVSNSNKEVYYYVDQKIIIQEGFDSFAGMISLAATALCHYLDTHREQLRLLDKAVLEIGAGTGLVSIVATLLGAQVTATDQPQILNNLRMNVRRNTRDCCRYTPQVAALSWGHDLEHTYPTSVYRYDYVLAADVASHYYCLDKLLVTMKHFCKPGTTLVWANKVRSEADLTFIENFKTTFNASLLAEDGDMKIFMATSRDGDIGEEHLEQNYCEVPLDSTEPDEDQNKDVSGTIVNCDRSEDLCRDEKEQNDELKSDEEAGNVREDGYTEDTDSDCTMSSSTLEDKNCAGSEYEKEFNEEEEEDEEEEERDDPKTEEPALQKTWRPAWAPRFVSNSNKEVYYYVDQKIIIQEGFDSFAGMISLAATALCHYLDTHREQLRLLDKAVLEIGAGTGLVSIVATLLGAQVTATDQPQILNNLRMNVRRNTRDCCRYTPQVAALSWGHDLEHTYPTSVYRYDYVLAADVASHYYCLDKLLVTMKHFCKPGTTLVWANKVRSEADLTFIENFKTTFNASLLAEDGDMKIFMATSRDGEIREEHLEQNYCEVPLDSTEPDEDQNKDVSGTIVNCDRSEDLCRDEKEQNDELKSDEEAGNVREDGYTEDTDSDCTMSSSTLEDCAGSEYEKEFNEEEEEDEEEKERDDPKTEEPALQKTWRPAWAPRFVSNSNKEVYYYVDQKIIIQEGFDSFAGMISLAATALCHYLDTHREQLRLLDKAVLEIGAGTGLVSIVATLLGAQVTATDQPQILNNLRMNVRRNTRDCCRYTPQVAALSWGHDLEHTYPTSVYRYDYVLAADVASHYYCLDKLLVTMKHFCKPGTTLVWANKVRSEADLTFIKNFKKTFNASLLAEDGDMKIFMATSRDGDIGEEHLEQNYCEVPLDSTEPDEDQNKDVSGTIVNCDRSEDLCRDEKEQNDELKSDEEAGNVREDGYTEDTDSVENSMEQTTMMHYSAHNIKKDIYHYVGQDIIIQESIDSNVMWPAALALCSFLDNNRDVLKFQGKKVLELGAGTGLVSIVASLLGASVTATDLKDVLANLRANVMRNTRGRCKHMPKVDNLSWGNDLEHTYPSTVHRYDYVLAADVVYHHDFLNELLTTMKYFNKPGTTLIWANNVRFETDLTFTENFKKAFNTKLMSDDGEIKIFKAASK